MANLFETIKFDGSDELKVKQFYLASNQTMIIFDSLSPRLKGAFVIAGDTTKNTFDVESVGELKSLIFPKEEEIKHRKFHAIKNCVNRGLPVYLYGEAGTGKNVICKQVAEELGLDFYFSNSVTQEYKISGYGDAKGEYVPTEFYKAFTKGGLFILDELDASSPEVLILLNAAIANRYFEFPVIGRVNAHEDFRVIAAGNTCGRGADEVYNGRMQLDGATLNRFAYVEVEYDERIENRLANNNADLVNFVRDLRKSSKKAGLPIVLSYRNISMMTELISMFSIREAMEMAIIKGMPKDDIEILYRGLDNRSNQYAEVFYSLSV